MVGWLENVCVLVKHADVQWTPALPCERGPASVERGEVWFKLKARRLKYAVRAMQAT